MTGLHAALAALLAEHRAGANPAPYTSERALIERIEALLDEHPADMPVATDSTEPIHDDDCESRGCAHCEVCGAGVLYGSRCSAHPMPGSSGTAPEPSDSPMVALIERSSFGTPEAVALRASVSDEVAARVVARAKELEADAPEPSDRAGLSETERIALDVVDAEHDYPTETDDGLVMRCRCGATPPSHYLGQQVDEALWLWEHRRREQHATVEHILADRLAVAEQERAQAVTVSAVRTEQRDRLRDELLPAERARAEAAEQEAGTLRAQVAAVEALADECASSPCIHLNEMWGRLRDALGDSAQVVQRIKDEAAAAELAKISAELYRDHDMPPRKDTRSYQYRDGWWDGVHHAAKVVEQRARRVRDGEPS